MGKKKRKFPKKTPAEKNDAPAGRRSRGPGTIPWLKIFSIALPLALAAIIFYNYPAFKSLPGKAGPKNESPGRGQGFSPFPKLDSAGKTAKIQFEEFTGSASCKGCHEREYRLWENSTHAKAGGEPGRVKIIAKFDGKPLHFKDAVVTPTISPAGEYIFIVEESGQPQRIIRADAVVGGGHMYGGGTQSFFTKLPDGTLRFLPFDFIRKENTWFVQLREGGVWVPVRSDIALADLLQWLPHRTLGSQEGTSNCQNCHGSQILLEYLPAENRYRTRYQTLQINCESCHGPGRRHIALAKREDYRELEDLGMEALATFGKDRSLKVCFQCHAVKDLLQEQYLPGDPLEDYYSLKLPILGSKPYLPDGRVRSFAYQQNHLFSDCYVSGSMTCVDCHDPHTQQYRDVFGKPLAGRFDNGQCTGCHASKARHPELHSRHKADSPGNLCTNCHMPFLQHRGIGQELVFARSDHVIPIPRPAFDAALGIENACSKCHRDKTVAWLQAKTEAWYGKLKPHHPVIAGIMQAEKVADMAGSAPLLLHPHSNHVIGQLTGLAIFIKRFLRPDMYHLDPDIVKKLVELSRSEDLDVKALALMALHLSLDHDPAVHALLVGALNNLQEDALAVRYRWALAADYLGSLYDASGDFANALEAHRKALQIKPNDAFTWINLGTAYRQLGDYSNSIQALTKALEIRPYQPAVHYQLAELYHKTGQRAEAIRSLKNVLQYDPGHENARLILTQLEKPRN